MTDTSDTSDSRSGSSNISFRRARPVGAKTKFERDIQAAINRGVSNCSNAMHWHTVTVPDNKGGTSWTDVAIKPHRQILTMMAPGAARCLCERQACQWAWTANWNHKGMYTSQWVLEGLEQKGIPAARDKDEKLARSSAKKVWPMNHSLREADMKQLMADFPEWHFIGAYGASHDHPVAHYRTKLSSERLMDKLPKGTPAEPKVYIDLNGNPAANAAYMRRNPGITIITLVECITPKDFINRATKWGPQIGRDGVQCWYDDIHVRDIPREMPNMGGVISGFISIHTTYYYDPEEIAALLAWAPGAVYYSSMHRFPEMSGFLNNKEQAYEKHLSSFGLRVVQTNVKTGEAYEHPDNAWWYDHDSRICGDKAFGWTMGELSNETYFFMATSVPVSQARMSSKCHSNILPPTPKSTGTAQSKEDMLRTRVVKVSLCGVTTQAPIDPQHVEFFDSMRKTLIGRPRGPKQYKDHTARCKVTASGMMSDKGTKIDAQQLTDLVRMTFMIDFEDNYGRDSLMFGHSYVAQIQADHLYKHGTGIVGMGTLSVLSDMLMEAVDSKNLKMAGVKALRSGLGHLQRKNVLNSVV